MSGFTSPTTDEVQRVLRRLTNYQLRRAFYEGLKNPLWVRPLADAGAFRDPPEPELADDGYVRETFWPEVAYLINVGPQVPAEVVDVLLTLGGSRNSWVRRAVFTIGSRIPASEALRLKPVIRQWESSGFGWRTDPHDLVSFAVNLIEGGKTKFGVSFANRLFRPRETEAGDAGPVADLKDHWYGEELPRLVQVLGDRALVTVLPWLAEHERIATHVGEGFDHSGFGRALISDRRGSFQEMSDALIDAVRDTAIDSFLVDPDATWAILDRYPILVVRRIALYSLSEAIRQEVERGGETSRLLSASVAMLDDRKCRDAQALVEFVKLAKTVATVSPDQLTVLGSALEEGQYSRAEVQRISERLRQRGQEASEVQAEIDDWQEDWRHRVLSGIGRDLLPRDLQERLDDLDARRGVLSDPVVPTLQVSGWVGPSSPIAKEDMSAMAPLELVTHLETWRDQGGAWGPEPSHEGQARVLTEVISAYPAALGDEQRLVQRLRPTYLRAILNGWEAARRAERELPWHQLLDVVADVLHHADASEVPAEGSRFDDDPDFREAKKTAIRLLVQLVQPATATVVPDQYIPTIATMLLESLRDWTSWNEFAKSGQNSGEGWDPLTVSLNWMWPIQLRGLISLVALGADTGWYAEALLALEHQLAREDSTGASRAVLGEGLGKLFNHAPDWLVQHMSEYFGTGEAIDRNQQVAVTTAIAVHYYHPALYGLLSDPMIALLSSNEDVAVGWDRGRGSPSQRVGEWVIDGIIRGQVGLDDRLRNVFYTQAPAETRGDAIGHIAWSFMHADTVDETIRDRLADLWDERVRHVRARPEDKAELKDFFWFVRSNKFPPLWWLPRLKEALDLDNELQTHGMIGEQLGAAAAEFPGETLEALTLLLMSEDTPFRDSYDLRAEALAPVIASCLDSGDPQLAGEARALMNLMGARGEIDLEQRVQAVRDAQAP